MREAHPRQASTLINDEVQDASERQIATRYCLKESRGERFGEIGFLTSSRHDHQLTIREDLYRNIVSAFA